MMKKTVAVLAATAILAAPLAASANSDARVNVSATVKPAPVANLTVNFDGLGFVGNIGDAAVTPRFTKNGVTATNTVDMTARGHYTLMVSAQPLATLPVMDPSAPPTPPVMLDVKRLQVASPGTGTYLPLTMMSTIVDQGTGDIIRTQKALNFKLDLSRPVFDDLTATANYNDQPYWDQLATSPTETNLFSQVTLSFSSF